jgi:protein-disulfide isomerase
LKQLEAHYGDKLRVEYHHFPLSFHSYAESSAIASMAAHKQGKFFEMVDKLYADTKKQDPASVEKYAEELGLDMAQYKIDVKSEDLLKYVRMDTQAGSKVEVSGTPSMFLNGSKVNARDFESYKTEIDNELAAVEKLTAGGDSVVDARKKRILAAINGVTYYEFAVERKEIDVNLAPPKPPAPPKPAPVDKTVYNAVINPGDPVKGPLDALVTIVECSDFQ